MNQPILMFTDHCWYELNPEGEWILIGFSLPAKYWEVIEP
jgi:hypothetical protein